MWQYRFVPQDAPDEMFASAGSPGGVMWGFEGPPPSRQYGFVPQEVPDEMLASAGRPDAQSCVGSASRTSWHTNRSFLSDGGSSGSDEHCCLAGASREERACAGHFGDDAEERAHDVMHPLEDLPVWVKPHAVLQMAWAQYPKPLPLGMTAGAAIPLVWLSSTVLWSFYVGFFPMVASAGVCHNNSFATFPVWLYLAFVPALACAVGVEWLCLRLVVVPKWQVLRTGTVFSLRVPFRLWLAFAALNSLVSYFNFASLSAFTGTMLKTSHCPLGSKLMELWAAVWAQSSLARIADDPSPHFIFWVIFTWGLKLVTLLQAVADSLPSVSSTPCEVDYELCSDPGRRYMTKYATLSHPWGESEHQQNHGAALMALAQANGMHTVFFNDIEYGFKKAAQSASSDPLGAAMHARAQLHRGIFASLSGVCVSGMQLNLQVSTFNMLRYLTGGPCHMLFVSIGLSGMSNMMAIKTCWTYVRKSKECLEELDEQVLGSGEQAEKLSTILWRCRLKFVLLAAAAACYGGTVAYAATKLAASFYCTSRSWNITGCTDLSGILS